MFANKLLRTVFIPTAALVAEKSQSSSCDCVCKPSELPIYATQVEKRQKAEVCQAEQAGVLEQAVGSVRRAFYDLQNKVRTVEQIAEDYVNMGIDGASDIISFLQKEDNTTPKYGAVAVGGLAGLVFGLRGGLFKRAFYTSVGALGMAAVCYPKEAAEYSQIGMEEATHYGTIAYNFVHGVKKDDPPLALPSLPNIPGSISELWDVAKNLGKSKESTVSEGESVDKCAVKRKKGDHEVNDVEIDALCVISEAHATAANKSCHCPIGACMGQHEEPAPQTESELEQSQCYVPPPSESKIPTKCEMCKIPFSLLSRII